jgi:ABC-2 type transport system permease protein
MFRTYKLTIACLKMFLRSRQALFFSLFMPMLILFIFGSIEFDKPSKIRVGVARRGSSPLADRFVKELGSLEMVSVEAGSLEWELGELKRGNRTAVIDASGDVEGGSAAASEPAGRVVPVYVNGGRPMESQIALSILNRFADRASLAAAQAPMLFTFQPETLQVHNARYIEFLLPGIMAMSIMQMSVFSVAFVFTRWKEQGILKRLTVTPVRPIEFVTANILTRLLMAVVQASIFVAVGVGVFHVHVAGPWWLLAVSIVLGSLMFLGLGFTISGLSKNTESVPVLSNLLVFPMLFTGNVFFSISNMPAWLAAVAKFLPLTFVSNAVRGVITEGAGVMEIKWDLLGMAVWGALLITTATLTFRFQDKEGG